MWKNLLPRLAGRGADEPGQTMVEYSLILTFISLVAVAILNVLGAQVIVAFQTASAGF